MFRVIQTGATLLRIKTEYEIHFELQKPTPIVSMLRLHPSMDARLLMPERHEAVASSAGAAEPLAFDEYVDSYGNRCARFVAPEGLLELRGGALAEADETPDPQGVGLPLTPVDALPHDALRYLVPSRYCEVDRFGGIAQDLFGHIEPGWALAAQIRDWVHWKVTFNYMMARATKTAMDVYTERVGVCRDYQHLAITLSRAMNLPARYVTGYLGDIRVPYSGPGDFSAWYQVWLGGRWWDMDARHNDPRYGRLLMAVGRDAADVAMTTSFGNAELKKFVVSACEVDAAGNAVPLPLPPMMVPPVLQVP